MRNLTYLTAFLLIWCVLPCRSQQVTLYDYLHQQEYNLYSFIKGNPGQEVNIRQVTKDEPEGTLKCVIAYNNQGNIVSVKRYESSRIIVSESNYFYAGETLTGVEIQFGNKKATIQDIIFDDQKRIKKYTVITPHEETLKINFSYNQEGWLKEVIYKFYINPTYYFINGVSKELLGSSQQQDFITFIDKYVFTKNEDYKDRSGVLSDNVATVICLKEGGKLKFAKAFYQGELKYQDEFMYTSEVLTEIKHRNNYEALIATDKILYSYQGREGE